MNDKRTRRCVRRRAADVRCPFYRSHTRHVIRCEGYDDDTVEATAFAREQALQTKLEDFCCKAYRYCYKYRQVMYAKYEDDAL